MVKALKIDSKYPPEQWTAAEYLLNERDVIVTFPTESGKSVIYQVLPPVMNSIGVDEASSYLQNPIALIVCLLKSLMSDQVSILQKKGLTAVAVGGGGGET